MRSFVVLDSVLVLDERFREEPGASLPADFAKSRCNTATNLVGVD